MMKKVLVLAACMLLFGCISFPITPTQSINEIFLGGDGSVKQVQTATGPKTAAAAEWPSDCTEKYRETVRGAMSMLQAMMGSMGSEMDPEDLAKFQSLNDGVNLMMDRTTCSFQQNNGDGTLITTMMFSYDDMQRLGQLLGSFAEEQGGSPMTGIKRLDDGNYRFTMPVTSSELSVGDGNANEIRITVAGDVQSITPGYVQEGGAYVYRDMDAVPDGMIEIVYTPKSGGFCGMGLILLAGIGMAALLAARRL